MIHIVFEEANKTILEQVIGMDPSLAGDIICIKDDYAVGPLEAIYETAGYQARKAWWEQVLEHSPYTQEVDLVNDKLAVHQLIKQMEEDADIEVWVWMGQNAHDVCGYYWVISQFKDFAGRIHVLYLNNLPFFNEKGKNCKKKVIISNRICIPSTSASVAITILLYRNPSSPSSMFKACCSKLNSSF